MKGRRLIGTATNTERYELNTNRTDLNLILYCLKKSVENGGIRYEDAANYVSLVSELEAIRDGDAIDELEEQR